MPSHEDHCKHTMERYGVRGDDIHTWMDEPCRVAGRSHRRFRHDLASMEISIRIFGAKYGDEMVRNIFLDHLLADSKENGEKDQVKTEDVSILRRVSFSAPFSAEEMKEMKARTIFMGILCVAWLVAGALM